ncbi:hypothetical protein ACFP2T_01845 [Plantactinospora solaniradicis]|uniref:Uncharacterized protein n=1 Tax=Plantactinospora solaniradicis TaxID=1723736 RepID=A0ABW1JZQ3_9ACTN
MIRRASRGVAVLAIGFGLLAGPLVAPSSAAPCPPGTEWDPIQRICIVIGPDLTVQP